MLSCVIDGQLRNLHLNGCESLAAILDDVNLDLAKGGKFIASLRVNGEEVEGNVKTADRCLDGVVSIEIMTDTPICLVGKILDEGQNYIDGLMEFLKGVAGNYSAGSDCADDSFDEAVQGLQWFVQMTDFIESTLKLDFNRLTFNGRTITEYVHNLNGILLEMAGAQEAGDPVLLADVLEYDLVPHLEEWGEIYILFKEKLSAE